MPTAHVLGRLPALLGVAVALAGGAELVAAAGDGRVTAPATGRDAQCVFAAERPAGARPVDLDALPSVIERAGLGLDALHRLPVRQGWPELPAVVVPSTMAIPIWCRLRGIAWVSGRWPVIVGDPATWEPEPLHGGPAPIVRASTRIDVDELLRRRSREQETPWRPRPVGGGTTRVAFRATRVDALSAVIGRSGRRSDRVAIALLPSGRGYEAAAYLAFGGWNDTPTAAQTVAVLRHWHRRFGGEVIGMSEDSVVVVAHRLPADTPTAASLVAEQWAFAPESYWMSVRPIRAAVAAGRRERVWDFWWD